MLGAEEQNLHTASLGLQRDVKSLLGAIAKAPQASKQDVQERQVQHCMAQLRAHIRDLELLAEEQDTYVLCLLSPLAEGGNQGNQGPVFFHLLNSQR